MSGTVPGHVPQRYTRHLARLSELVLQELDRWHCDEVEELWQFAHRHLQRTGKQLRPVLCLAIAELLGGNLDLVAPAAGAVELYHMASLIIDDVQDNSAIRHGEATVHARSSRSTAINLALFVRSLSYHLIGQTTDQDPAAKLRLYTELDAAATRIVLGQGIDLGWQERWYASYHDFPYGLMSDWKTGSLFGCAAAMGACTAGADTATVSAARAYGTAFGALYQKVDDFLDAFGDGAVLGRPPHEDFREGKMSGPVLGLLSALEKAGRDRDIDVVLGRLGHSAGPDGWEWLMALMAEHEVPVELRRDLVACADALRCPAFGTGAPGRSQLGVLIDAIMAPILG